MNIEKIFEENGDEFLKFDRVVLKHSSRPDIHAFILLNRLVPGDSDIVCSAEHDQIWLAVTPEELASVASFPELIELHRCGVLYDSELDALFMFV